MIYVFIIIIYDLMLFNLGSKFVMSVLHIAQKNSIAKEVANILSNGSRRTGNTLSKFNPVFHFSLDGTPHIFSSVRGHLFDYELPPQCKSWNYYDNKKILTREVPMVRKMGPGMQDLFSNLHNLAKGKQRLILWLDCDRQGQAIAFQVINVIRSINPKIRIQRARFAAVTERDIMNAYENLVEPNQREADAVNYRIQIDFRMGCAFTRYQSTAFNKRFLFKEHSVVSYGPCQIPTLGFVVNRYLEIFNFKPEKYWVLNASIHLDEKVQIELRSQRGSIRDETQSNILFYNMYVEAVNEQGMVQGKIISRNKNQKKKNRPFPLTTVQFQKLATDKLKITSAEAMKIAQKLYMSGYISYPRTETNAFPSTINPINIVKLFESSTYADYVKSLVQNDKYLRPKSGNQNDQAHTPIHPVKPANQNQLTPEQWKVYDLIMRHFLACCSKDAIGIQSQIIAVIGSEYFRASHLHIKEKNYLQIYPFEKWVQGQFPGQIPSIFNASVDLKESKTQAPAYLTQSDLITQMQKNQIGTDSTIHEHIETIQHRKYAIKSNNTFKPTNLGASLIITYKELGIQLENCHVRRLMEQRMNRIAEGSLSKHTAVLQTLEEVKPIYEKLKEIQNDWINKMESSMKTHHQLKNIEVQALDSVNQQNNNQNFNPDSDDLSQNTVQPRFICFFCKKPGHTVTNCPEKKNNQVQNNNNVSNHYANNNSNHNNNYDYDNDNDIDHNDKKNKKKGPKPKIERQNKSNDKKKGPKTKVQRQNNTKNQNKKDFCFNCKTTGHKTDECPKKETTTINKQSKYKCFICDKEGHFAPTCPQRKNMHPKQ